VTDSEDEFERIVKVDSIIKQLQTDYRSDTISLDIAYLVEHMH
jgi:hypothetical protein